MYRYAKKVIVLGILLISSSSNIGQDPWGHINNTNDINTIPTKPFNSIEFDLLVTRSIYTARFF